MDLVALILVVVAAFCHATWNLLAKRSSGGVAFVWLIQATGVVIYAPLVIVLFVRNPPEFSFALVAAILASALFHVSYFLSLQRGYRSGDLSLVYPIARGTGPALATLGAIFIFGERPGPIAVLGAVLVISGVIFMSFAGRRSAADPKQRREGVKWGVITGLFIAFYSMNDSFAVSALGIFPFFYLWLADVVRTAALAPFALRRLPAVRYELAVHRREVLGVAFLSPLSYLLVLFALSFTPLSYVAPAREMSILIGTIMGSTLLAEEDGRRRILAALLIVGGVVALAVG